MTDKNAPLTVDECKAKDSGIGKTYGQILADLKTGNEMKFPETVYVGDAVTCVDNAQHFYGAKGEKKTGQAK